MKTLPIVAYPKVVEEFLPQFTPLFNKSQLRHLAQYLAGLFCVTTKRSAESTIPVGLKSRSMPFA